MPGYMKLLIVCGIIFLAVKFHQQFIAYLISSSDLTKKMMTKYEIDQFEHQIFLDFTVNNIPIPSKNEFGWRDYIRAKNKNKDNISRDPSIDLWGIPYQIRPSSSVSLDLPPGLMIRSAGPDTTFYNDDDIYTVCKSSSGR
jgi:hypothetical protein